MQRHPLVLAGIDIYRPVSAGTLQFRLLTILPTRTAKVHCILHIASLDHDIIPAYETISYVWGDRDQRDSIVVNGTILNVPHSSALALRHLRQPDRERKVWIDAICINQADLEERSAQVRMMAEIYSRGTQNLIFLGSNASGDAEGVVDLLMASEERIDVAVEELSEVDRVRFIEGWSPKAWHGNTLFAELDPNGYRKLYSLPWFR